MRRAYGRRQSMLQLRTALFADKDKFDPETFAWSGGTRSVSHNRDGDSAQDHVVNVLCATMRQNPNVTQDELMKLAAEWGLPHKEPEA